MELAALTVIVLALLVDRHLSGRAARAERDGLLTQMEHDRLAAQQERAELLEQAHGERAELLTRIQHPQLLVTREEPQAQAATEYEDDDEWAKVGTVLPLVEADDDLGPGPEA